MARITHKDIGDRMQPQATFTVASVETDPTVLVVSQKDPSGTISVVSTESNPSVLTSASTPVARLSAGVFLLQPGISATEAGYWMFRFAATGAAESAQDFEYIVEPSEFFSDAGLSSRALVGYQETRDWLNQQNVTTSEGLELVRVINDVSDRIHYEAGREFVAKDSGTSRTFDVRQYGYCVYVDDMAALTTASPAITITNHEGTTIKTMDAADITTYPLNREPWEPIRKLELKASAAPLLYPGLRVTVEGTWGFPEIPGNIRQAALDTIAAVIDRDVEHYREDITAATQQGGSTIVLSSPQQMFIALPPQAFAVVRSYRDPALG